MRILIVDDNPTQSEALQKLLKLRFDAQVFVVTTMRECKKVVEANDLDAIILDLALSDSSIEETLKTIPQLPYPVYVYTGYDDPMLREKALEAKAEDYIVKSTAKSGIVERIAHLQFKRTPDRKLLLGAYTARKADERARNWSELKGTVPRVIAAAVTVLSFAGGITMGSWGLAKSQGANETRLANHLDMLDRDIAAINLSNKNQDLLVNDLFDKARQSTDERMALRDQQKMSYDQIIDWLKRIEAKVDRKSEK